MTKKRLLAIDLGYSSVKVAYYDKEGILQFDKYISAIAKIPDPLEIDDDVMFRLNLDYYVLGPAALKIARSQHLKLETFEDMKEIYPVWISYLLKKYGGVDSFDHVIIGLSLAFKDRADELLKHLYDTLIIEKPEYFICLPQGLSCKLAYSECGLDIRETSRRTDSRLRSFIILDGGYLTADFCCVIGNTSSGAAVGIDKSGVINISYQVQDYLFKNYGMQVSIKEAQTIVDNQGAFSRRGREYNIKEEVDKFSKKYLAQLLNLLESKFGESLDATSGLLVLGGVAYFFKRYLNDPEFIEEVEKHFPVSFIKLPQTDGEFYNCFSYLRFAEKMIEKEES